jgi:hypothetical protein
VSTGSSPQASTSAGQTRPAPEDVTVGTPPFPDRPLLTTPPRLIDPEVAKLERECLAAQPGLGLAGLLFALAVFFALALGAGNVGSSLLIFGPLAAFGLAAIAMVAFWWEDWPFTVHDMILPDSQGDQPPGPARQAGEHERRQRGP